MRPPKGIFLKMFNLLISPNLMVFGFVCLVIAVALASAVHLDWALGMSYFVFSIGLGILFSSALARMVHNFHLNKLVLLFFSLGCAALFLSQQMQAQGVNGVVLLDESPVETVTVQKGGTRIAHHLGAPLSLRSQAKASPSNFMLSYGIEGALYDTAPFDPSAARTQIGPWIVEPLGKEYRAGDLSVVLAVESETGEWDEHVLKTAQSIVMTDSTVIRLASVSETRSGEGHRIIVELIKDGLRSYRMLYDQAPRLDEAVGSAAPKIRVQGLRHEPVRRFKLYSQMRQTPLQVFVGCMMLTLLFGLVMRERT